MLIIGCDYHPSAQQIACVDTDTGELSERRLGHREQAEQFYRELKQQNVAVRAQQPPHVMGDGSHVGSRSDSGTKMGTVAVAVSDFKFFHLNLHWVEFDFDVSAGQFVGGDALNFLS